MREFMAVTKALADPNRVSILLALEGRELCVCQVVELLGLAPSTVSKHLFILKQSRLIEDRKEGRWMYYRLAGEDAPSRQSDWPVGGRVMGGRDGPAFSLPSSRVSYQIFTPK